MAETIFRDNAPCTKTPVIRPNETIMDFSAKIEAEADADVLAAGDRFAADIADNFIANFEKSEADGAPDRMAHVSTFIVKSGMIYMTYYANTSAYSEDPDHQTARLVYCPADHPEKKTFIDILSAGDILDGKRVTGVYDTILAEVPGGMLCILFTARIETLYYRLYRFFDPVTETLGPVGVNRFRVGDVTNDYSTSGILNALTENGIFCKEMYSDIGIMQEFSPHAENGETWWYTGTYSGHFTAIVKSRDFITWEYVSQPDFPNNSEWENTTYVIGDRCFYFVRQCGGDPYGFLTVYDLKSGLWEKPVLIADCQSRGDFFLRNGQLYLLYAPIDREHLGIVRVDTENIAGSTKILQAKMHESAFYPYTAPYRDGLYGLSYTMNRKHIRFSAFDPGKYLN